MLALNAGFNPILDRLGIAEKQIHEAISTFMSIVLLPTVATLMLAAGLYVPDLGW